MLKILYSGHENSRCTLEDAGFTRVNFVDGTTKNNTLDVDTPKGVLGGSIATMKGDYEVGACTGAAEIPVGMFLNDAAGKAFENEPAKASGVAPFMHSQGSVEVNVYETRNAGDTADITYAINDKLYTSVAGLLTNEGGYNGEVVGILTKVPTSEDLWMGLNLRV